MAVPTDLARAADCEALVEKAHLEFGRVDVLVNNAFTMPPFRRLEEYDVEKIEQSFEVNLFAPLRLSQAVIPHMRAAGEGSIVMIGRDAVPPYERPPLSKEYLAGDKPFERIMIRPEKFWADKNITLKLGCAVNEIDPARHEAKLSDGTTLTYGKMIWAGGGDPRRLPAQIILP